MIVAIPEPFKTVVTFAHPLLMLLTLFLALYAGYVGWQYRRIRSTEGEEKKALISKRYNILHHKLGSAFLVLMVAGAVGGMAVTYNDSGKLFVGGHLLAGLGLTILAALSAALAPLLQQGKEWARVTHITVNTALIGVFAWQTLTGWQIVQRILEQMSKAS
jgi:TRAP-type C4-dicarboxylate transport system permease small subunit